MISVDRLLAFGSDEGAASLGLEEWPDVTVDTAHASLRGIEEPDLQAVDMRRIRGSEIRDVNEGETNESLTQINATGL